MNELCCGDNSEVLHRWLDYAYDMMRHPGKACQCEPYDNGGIRWPGYIGSDYRGVLFVGARHNANGLRDAGLLATNRPLRRYADELRSWSALQRTERGDRKMLDAMRCAYRDSYPLWAKRGVWKIFQCIRDSMCLNWDNVASVNLARCYLPEIKTGEDDQHILSHWEHCSLDPIIKALQPSIVFVSKDNEALRDKLPILGEKLETPLVVRYAGYGTGMRHGKNYKTWVPEEKAKWRRILDKRCSK
jgi:hypothetical protein